MVLRMGVKDSTPYYYVFASAWLSSRASGAFLERKKKLWVWWMYSYDHFRTGLAVMKRDWARRGNQVVVAVTWDPIGNWRESEPWEGDVGIFGSPNLVNTSTDVHPHLAFVGIFRLSPKFPFGEVIMLTLLFSSEPPVGLWGYGVMESRVDLLEHEQGSPSP